jgi:hypothetical protein
MLLGVGLSSAARADEPTVMRFLEFRDGSLLRLPVLDQTWNVSVVRPNGQIEILPLRVSRLQNLTLSREEGFDRKRALLFAVRELGSNSFQEREHAQQVLLKMGAAVRNDLLTCLRMATDPEMQARLRTILGQLPANANGGVGLSFDVFQLKDQQLCGDVGGDGITIVTDKGRLRLTRQEVLAMTADNPGAVGGNAAMIAGFERVGPTQFPRGCWEEGFETTPDGSPLHVGDNIERAFISKGFLLSTSFSDSYVSVNTYTVEGKSRGLSAATHQPLWEGEITIRFIKPGYEHIPAGVTYFGCYLAAVVPQGTAMIAYDREGRELGTIHTQRTGVDFLGVRSSMPIYKIRIVPNLSLDKDYTLDDFIYTPPQTSEALHPDKFTVYLSGGDRIACGEVLAGNQGLVLQGLPGRLPDLTVKLTDVLRVVAPGKGRKEQPPPPGVFAELRDGSQILGHSPKEPPGSPVFPRRPLVLQEKNNLAGLWSSDFPRLVPKTPASKPTAWDPDQKKWQELSHVRLLEEIVLWKDVGGSFDARSYRKLTPLWLTAPSATPRAGTWHVRTVHGEDLVLSGDPPFTGRLSQELSTHWQGQSLRIPAAEVVALYQFR